MKINAASDLSNLALQIWKCGVDAVRSDQVVQENCVVENGGLRIASKEFAIDKLKSICVVGAGKAGAGMAAGLESAFGDELLARTTGWINVPEGCEKELKKIHLHPARPAGKNEPTEAGVLGTKEILRLASSLDADDICVCLLSGGGSALLPSPKPGVTLRDKLRITQLLSAAGANINQLNAVRRQLSDVKAGGLARTCSASNLITLIISDVIGDPLNVIASGPTVTDVDSSISASEVINQFVDDAETNLYFQQLLSRTQKTCSQSATSDVTNCVIANNRTAVNAAAEEATRIGCHVEIIPSESPTTTAEQMGVQIATRILEILAQPNRMPVCLISGGEPVVQLTEQSVRGKGGRNQQLVLSALSYLLQKGEQSVLERCAILAGGTDGEDGPTDAAGAIIGPHTVSKCVEADLEVDSYLSRNDAYTFFDQIDGLIKTGPTHTNVCDLRVVIVQPD